jgi:hypothetical protein
VNRENTVPMKHEVKVADHVEWNPKAGRARGTIKEEGDLRAIKIKTSTVRASNVVSLI